MSDSPLFLVAVIRPQMDRATEAEAALREMIAGTRAEPGCISYELVVDADDPTTWVMLEKFRSRADWEAHMAAEHVQQGNAALAGLLREPTDLRFYTVK